MAYVFVGLGNPTEEYEGTRHNVGRDFLRALLKKEDFTPLKMDKTLRAQVSRGTLGGSKVSVVLPEVFMNLSGASVRPVITSKKALEQLVVLHDELDLPLGAIKLSYGSGHGGHKGVESVQKALKSKDFLRIRIGISPSTASGKLRKPDSEKIVNFVLGSFTTSQEAVLKKVRKQVFEVLTTFVEHGREQATMEANSR